MISEKGEGVVTSSFRKNWEDICKQHAASRSLGPAGHGKFLILSGFFMCVAAIASFHSNARPHEIAVPLWAGCVLALLAVAGLLFLIRIIWILNRSQEFWNPALSFLGFESSGESQADIEFLSGIRSFSPQEIALGKTWLQNRRKSARDRLGYIAIAAAVSFGSSVVGGKFLEWNTAFFLAAAAVFCLLLMLAVYFNQPVAVLEEQVSLTDYFLQNEQPEGCRQS